MKRDVGIGYIAMRKIHYNVMRFGDTLSVDEAEVLAGRFKSVSARYYVLHDPEKLTDKYDIAWSNFGFNIRDLIVQVKITIENFSSLTTMLGGGFFVGILVGYVLKKVIKIAAVILGLFLTALTFVIS
jgi:hypothetical protein